ncbi:MAG: MarR family transcriptional regulator [Chloroflexi bacterium]|nr:MAG: MarR family transcriptional regulator [Chloroflexota bacterium]
MPTDEETIDLITETDLPFADQVFHKFLDLLRFKRQYANRFIEQYGIKPRELSLLLFFAETGGATVGQAQAFLHNSASTVSALIAKLEKDGLVTRTRSQEDNRVVNVELTEAGRTVIENTPLGGLPLLRRNLRRLPDKRLQEIKDVLVELMHLMEVNKTE